LVRSQLHTIHGCKKVWEIVFLVSHVVSKRKTQISDSKRRWVPGGLRPTVCPRSPAFFPLLGMFFTYPTFNHLANFRHTSFLCQLAFHCYDKIPGTVNLKGRKVSFD
jgi:hypothetical protein